MIKKLFLTILLLSSTLIATPTYPRALSAVISTLMQFPEARELIYKVEREGPIHVTNRAFKSPSSAMWDGYSRTIVLNTSQKVSFGQQICSVLFELHNAISTQEFNYLDQQALLGKISKSEYIERVESIEYRNAQQTAQLINKAVYQGVYSCDARWPIAPTFEEHFRIQKKAGHSQAIARAYDWLCCN